MSQTTEGDKGRQNQTRFNASAGLVSVLLGRGDGTFQMPQIYTAGSTTVSMAVGGFNGDSVPDLAVANETSSGTVSVLLNQVQQTTTVSLSGVSVFGGGSHSVLARYGGDSSYAAVNSTPIPLTSSLIPTGLQMGVSPSSGVTSGQTVTLTATLSPISAYNYTASGSVAFYKNGTVLGSAPLINGVATLQTASLTAGNDSLTAIYSGDTNFQGNSSGAYPLTVAPVTSFTVAALPSAETIYLGVVAGFALELKSVNDSSSSVKLTCSGGPAGSQCANLPQMVRVNGTAYAVSGILFPKSTSAGIYTMTFTGTSGALTASTTATFTVK